MGLQQQAEQRGQAPVGVGTQTAAASHAEAAARVAYVLVIAHHPVMAQNITSAARHACVRQRGTAVVIVGWHCTHATQWRHGRDSGGAVAAAWGARAIACIGPVVNEISGRCPDGRQLFFNFSKLLFYFCPIPGS